MYHLSPFNSLLNRYHGLPITGRRARVFHNGSVGGMYTLTKIFVPLPFFRRKDAAKDTKIVTNTDIPANTADPLFQKSFLETSGQLGAGKRASPSSSPDTGKKKEDEEALVQEILKFPVKVSKVQLSRLNTLRNLGEDIEGGGELQPPRKKQRSKPKKEPKKKLSRTKYLIG